MPTKAPEMNSKRPELHTNQMTLSEHGYKQMKDRFGISNRNEALGQVRGWLRQSERIGQVVNEDDSNEAILYAHGRTAIHVSLDLKVIITVRREEHVTYEPIKNKIALIHSKEFRKFDRLERCKERKLKLEKVRVNMEVAQLEYRRVRTRSENVRKYCDGQKQILLNYIEELKQELLEIKTVKRHVANSMVAVV